MQALAELERIACINASCMERVLAEFLESLDFVSVDQVVNAIMRRCAPAGFVNKN